MFLPISNPLNPLCHSLQINSSKLLVPSSHLTKPRYSCGQTKSSNLITWEPNFLSKFWLQIRNQGPWKHSEKVLPYFSHTFLVVPNFWVFSTHPKVSGISHLWINCMPSATPMSHLFDRCVKKRIRAQLCLFMGDLTWNGFVHMTISANFPPLLRDFRWIFGKDFDGIR